MPEMGPGFATPENFQTLAGRRLYVEGRPQLKPSLQNQQLLQQQQRARDREREANRMTTFSGIMEAGRRGGEENQRTPGKGVGFR